MVGSTPPEMTRADRRRARPGRGAGRGWRAVLCVALLAALLPAAAGPAAAQSDPPPADVSGSKFTGTAEIDSPGCYFGSIDKRSNLHEDDKNRYKKIHEVDGSYKQNPGLYNNPDSRPPPGDVLVADVDRVKVTLSADTVYVFEVLGRDSGGGTLVDPELSGVYVEPGSDLYNVYKTNINTWNQARSRRISAWIAAGRPDPDVMDSDFLAGVHEAYYGPYDPRVHEVDRGVVSEPFVGPPYRLDDTTGQIFGNGIEDEDRAGTPRVAADEPRVHEYVLFDEDDNLIPVLFDGNPMLWLNDDGNVLDYGGDPVFVDENGVLVSFDENGDPVDDVYLVFLDENDNPVFENEYGIAVSAYVTVEYVTIREKDIIDTNDMTLDDAYDSDDGAGQDAWMLFKPLASGDHFLQIEGSGGFLGSYTVRVYEASDPVPCKPTLTIKAVAETVYAGADAVFEISGTDMNGAVVGKTGAVVELEYTYVGEDYFMTSPDPVDTRRRLMQLTGESPWTLSIPTVVVDDDDDNGSVMVKIIDLVGYDVGTPGSATVVVRDDVGGPAISIEAVEQSVLEGEPAEFLIRGPRSLEDKVVKLKYSYVGDYFALSSPWEEDSSVELTQGIQQLDGAWKVTVETLDDGAIEKELGSVMIAIQPDDIAIQPNDDVYTVGAPASATVVVVDDDNAPNIMIEAEKNPDGLPLWRAVVHWSLPDEARRDDVSHWEVQWARVRPARVSPCEVLSKPWGKSVLEKESVKLGVEWFIADDSVHFQVRAIFASEVSGRTADGPWSKWDCREAPAEQEAPAEVVEVAWPQVTATLKSLPSEDGVFDHHEDGVLDHDADGVVLDHHDHHSGVDNVDESDDLFKIHIEFHPAVNISRSELNKALTVKNGTLNESHTERFDDIVDDVIVVDGEETETTFGITWAIAVTPDADNSIMTITLDCQKLQQCTVGDSVTVLPRP